MQPTITADVQELPRTDAAADPGTKQHLLRLTSLRWFAASLVFFTHTQALFVGDAPEGYLRIANHGSVGVSFFFILSGFVLAWSWRPGDSKRQFYRRRIARIMPAYWVTCLLAFPVGYFVDGGINGGRIVTTLFTLTGLQSWVPEVKVYHGGNAVAWSLSDELFFYAVFPFVIALLFASRRPLRALLVALFLSAGIAAVAHPSSSGTFAFWFANVAPFVRVFEFVAGVCMAVLLRRGHRLRLSPPVALVIATAAWLAGGWVPPWAVTHFVTLIPFCLLIYAAAQADLANVPSWLHARWLVLLGQWSFAFYLLHQMIIRLLTLALPDSQDTLVTAGLIVSGYGLAIAASCVLFTYVERPLERRIRHGRGSVITEGARV